MMPVDSLVWFETILFSVDLYVFDDTIGELDSLSLCDSYNKYGYTFPFNDTIIPR